jgi:hypothetical protein
MARNARTEAEFNAIGGRLYYAAEDRQFSMAQCIEILDVERANPRFLKECRQLYSATQFAISPHSAEERDLAFAYFAGLLSSAESDIVRRGAAAALKNVGLREFPLTAEQLAAVRQMRQDARDADTVELLDKALAIPAAKRARQTQPARLGQPTTRRN